MDNNFSSLVKRLVGIRLKVGMSRYALAKELDVSNQHLLKFEKEEVRSAVLLVNYIYFFNKMGVDADYIINGTGEPGWSEVSDNVKHLLAERKRTRRCVGNVDEDFII